ncbi:MAG TPA: hypothetical protein VHE37_04895 [Nevskiaceae bacterium]|nr:hypothetical protein [Nevskiaceae bacterium]
MKFAPGLALAAMLALNLPAWAVDDPNAVIDDSPSSAAMAVDLLMVRPLSLAATGVGCVLFVLDLPLSIIQGELPREPARKLVIEPARFTFTRRLGSMEYSSPK